VAQIVHKNLPQGERVILMEDTPSAIPEVEVPPSGKRVFSMAYKRRILDKLDACSHMGEKAALLRREGLYASYVTKWRRQLAQNDPIPSAKKTPARKARNKGGRPRLSRAEREARPSGLSLRVENERLKKELERANLAIAVQKNSASCWRASPPRPATTPPTPSRRATRDRLLRCGSL
jgi:transposase